PTVSSQVYDSRGPIRSQSQPKNRRAKTVDAVEAMMHQPTCSGVNWNSFRTTGIRGVMPNQAKKQKKKASHVRWNARICGVEKRKSSIRSALWVVSTTALHVV